MPTPASCITTLMCRHAVVRPMGQRSVSGGFCPWMRSRVAITEAGTGTSRTTPERRFLRLRLLMIAPSRSRSAWVRCRASVIRQPVQARTRQSV